MFRPCAASYINPVLMVIDVWNVWLGRWAIRLLEEERNNLLTDLNVAMSKSKMKEHDRYRAKFANLIRETKQAELELSEQRQIEREVDKEILQLEIRLNKPKTKTSKLLVCDGQTLTIVSIIYPTAIEIAVYILNIFF